MKSNLKTANGFEKKLEEIITQVRTKHPEQAPVIDSLAPVARLHVAFLEEARTSGGQPGKPYTVDQLPVDTDTALNMVERLAVALSQGFPQFTDCFQAAAQALAHRPSPIRSLCRAVLTEDGEKLVAFAHSRHLPTENPAADCLRMLLLQTARALAARASLRVRQEESRHDRRACPCCGSAPDLGIIHGQEGKRLLHCSLCGHMWQYSRTACAFCGQDKANNLDLIFEEGRREEWAEHCNTCGSYLLGVDIRALDVPLELAYYLTLGMGHLDALMQQS